MKMKIGLPKGLLYSKYRFFAETFFTEMGAELVPSPDTNRHILDEGVRYCVDEACLPVKLFHGHVAWLRNRCDAIFIPRIMQLDKREFICPKFCGIAEMVANTIPDLPPLIAPPIYAWDSARLRAWAKSAASLLSRDSTRVSSALERALESQRQSDIGIKTKGRSLTIAVLGHPYQVYDSFVNMNLMKKLERAGAGVLTLETLPAEAINKESDMLFKKPFWSFARENYGGAVSLFKEGGADGFVYLSSFSCGIDSVVIELIRDKIGDFPLLVLKIDEHTGEAGFDTRLEAFMDLLERRRTLENNRTPDGEYRACCQSAL